VITFSEFRKTNIIAISHVSELAPDPDHAFKSTTRCRHGDPRVVESGVLVLSLAMHVILQNRSRHRSSRGKVWRTVRPVPMTELQVNWGLQESSRDLCNLEHADLEQVCAWKIGTCFESRSLQLKASTAICYSLRSSHRNEAIVCGPLMKLEIGFHQPN
jgi:hypothetical protein